MTDDFDPEVVLLRQIRRRRILVAAGIVAIACVAMYPCLRVVFEIGSEVHEHELDRAEHDHPLTPEQRATVESALATAEATLPTRNALALPVLAAAGELGPRPDLGPCPIRIPLRAPSSAERHGSLSGYDQFDVIAIPGRRSFPWFGTLGMEEAPRVTLARERIESLRERIWQHDTIANNADLVSTAAALVDTFWTWEVVIAADVWSMPSVDVSGSTFTEGYVHGIAYLHDYASRSILCAGEIEAESTSDAVEYRAGVLDQGRTPSEMLRAEMDAEIERAISRGLIWRAGPRVAAE